VYLQRTKRWMRTRSQFPAVLLYNDDAMFDHFRNRVQLMSPRSELGISHILASCEITDIESLIGSWDAAHMDKFGDSRKFAQVITCSPCRNDQALQKWQIESPGLLESCLETSRPTAMLVKGELDVI